MSAEHIDRLIEQLLRETLGGDRPRDLTERVMVQARAYDRMRRHWWVGAASAIAASAAITAGLFAFWPTKYPDPVITQGQAVSYTGDQLQHGSRIVTEDDAAELHLGGYVQVTLAPQTAMTLGGAKFEEKVMLEQGNIDVNVTKKRGTFEVVVGKAIVHVTGTSFHVGVSEEKTEKSISKNLLVHVNEGSVVVRPGDGSGPVTLTADSEKKFQISYEPIQVGPSPSVKPKPRAVAGGASEAGGRGGTGARGRGGEAAGGGPSMLGPQTAVNTGNRATLPPPGNVNRTQPSPVIREARIIAENDAVLDGILGRQQEGLYTLQPDGSESAVLLFNEQAPLEKMPKLGTHVRVVWQKGKVSKVEALSQQ